jgi:hypothetical protein
VRFHRSRSSIGGSFWEGSGPSRRAASAFPSAIAAGISTRSAGMQPTRAAACSAVCRRESRILSVAAPTEDRTRYISNVSPQL